MRDLIKIFILGIALFFAPAGFSATNTYRLVVLPDNIVTESVAVDSYIYNSTSEFFTNEIINLLNQTDYIKCPTVSTERDMLKSSPSTLISARDITNKFKTSYNIDFPKIKRITDKNQTNYIALITSTIDAENYVLRRTVWDFLNIAGASVIDPAYKISTYVVLLDAKNQSILWSNTFYKTISTIEGRILTRGPSPQTEQLQKIRDYSRMLCPEIAYNLQKSLLTASDYAKETNKIYYDMANFDNVFTKKYRRWAKEGKKDYNAAKENFNNTKESIKTKYEETKVKKETRAELKTQVKQVTEEEKNIIEKSEIKQIQPKEPKEFKLKTLNFSKPTKIVQPLDFEDKSLFEPVYIQKSRKNNLIEYTDISTPPLRGYDKL